MPEKYRGLTMTKARDAVVADMEAAGLFNPETDREDREIDLAHSDRSKTPIEPYLADQWFVKMDELRADRRWTAVDRRPREDHAGAVREELSRLAQREARLADGAAVVVGTSHSGLDKTIVATSSVNRTTRCCRSQTMHRALTCATCR